MGDGVRTLDPGAVHADERREDLSGGRLAGGPRKMECTSTIRTTIAGPAQPSADVSLLP